jgi:hypothetical protein
MIATVKVEIPDGWELACDELRLPKAGEYYLTKDLVMQAHYDFFSCQKCVIVRRVEPWKQPDFLKPGWIAMDESGEWYWYTKEPFCSPDGNQWFSGNSVILMSEVNWTPPQCSDWKQSKRIIE